MPVGQFMAYANSFAQRQNSLRRKRRINTNLTSRRNHSNFDLLGCEDAGDAISAFREKLGKSFPEKKIKNPFCFLYSHERYQSLAAIVGRVPFKMIVYASYFDLSNG